MFELVVDEVVVLELLPSSYVVEDSEE